MNTYDWFKEHLVSLDAIEGYDPHNRALAMQTLMEHNGLVTGLIYQDKEKPSYENMVPGFKETGLANQDLSLNEETFNRYVQEFM